MIDRLIELLGKAFIESDDNFGMPNVNQVADHLIANGVILPPCKVGQAVWFIGDGKIVETNAEKIILKQGGIYIKLGCNAMYETTCRSIGKTVFLTKEDAERALTERNNNEKL